MCSFELFNGSPFGWNKYRAIQSKNLNLVANEVFNSDLGIEISSDLSIYLQNIITKLGS